MKRESAFQHELIGEIRRRWPGAIVLKNDAEYMQGIPDLSVFYGAKWAALECKRSEREAHRPNQDHYVALMDGMSFARFVYPENREEVLEELGRVFGD